MAEDVSTKISPSLHPENVKQIDGYDDDTRVFLAPTEEAFTAAYNGVQAVWDVRAVLDKDTSRNDDAKLLQIDALANKQLDHITRTFDRARENLTKAIAGIERELTAPVQSRAGVAVATEIRAHCKALPTGERIGFIQRAIDAGDEATVSSLLGAPPYLSGLTPELQAAYTKVYREKNMPDVAKRLRAMTGARDMIEQRGGLIFKALEDAVGARPDKARKLREASTAADRALIMAQP